MHLTLGIEKYAQWLSNTKKAELEFPWIFLIFLMKKVNLLTDGINYTSCFSLLPKTHDLISHIISIFIGRKVKVAI